MDQKPFHPSVNARAIKLGRRYTKLQAATRQFRKDINDFIDSTDAVLAQFMDHCENRVILICNMDIPEGVLEQQDFSETMLAQAHKHMPGILQLTHSAKTKTDHILDHEKLLESSLAQLQLLHTDKQASLAETTRLEQQLHDFEQTLIGLNAALSNCRTNIQEMQAFIRQFIN